MLSTNSLLERCFRWARTAPEKSLPDGAPTGFATRVLAQLRTPEARDWTLWLLPRAVGVAMLVTATMLAVDRVGQASLESDLEAGLIVSALEVQP
jgi:hypothetical protein